MIRITTLAGALLMNSAALALAETVEVSGMRMHYEVSGEGDPLVVLHGAYMSIPAMGEIIPRLARTHRVHAIEMQGHGRTEAPRALGARGLRPWGGRDGYTRATARV